MKLWQTYLALGGSNPILKVLSSMRTHRVRSLLMGGQACALYGAAEFSISIIARFSSRATVRL